MVGRRGLFADWIAAVRGTLAMRREKGKARVGLMAGGVVLTLAFLGLFVIGIRSEITDSGDPDDAEVGAADSDVAGLAGAGSTSSSDTTGDGTTTDPDDPGGAGSGTTAEGSGPTGADGSTSSTGVLGREGGGSGQGETPPGGGSGGTSLITTTTSTTTSTTQPPGSSTPTTDPPDGPGLVGGLLDILGLGG